MAKRVWLHIGFWSAYLLVNGYIEVALVNYSYFDLPLWIRIQKGFGAELAILPIKMASTYYIMYRLIPKYIFSRQYWRFLFSVIALMIVAIFFYRLVIGYFIFPFIYEETYESHPFLSMLPRHLWTVLDFFSIAGIAGAIKMARLRISDLEKEKQLVEDKLQSELNFLRSQINPHFLFNTLNNIYGLARKQSEKTPEVVMHLSKMLRFMLYECTAPLIPLHKEIKLIKDYIELEKLRYGDNLQVQFNDETRNVQLRIAPLLLLPFVENAFKYGISEHRFRSLIDIQLSIEGDCLYFEIRNSKEDDFEAEESGIGLANVKRRLILLYPGEYHQLDIQDRSKAFEVKLMLKLNRNEKAEMSDR